MKQKDNRKRMCLDVSVKRGAECNTDRQLLCATVKGWLGIVVDRGKGQTKGTYMDMM